MSLLSWCANRSGGVSIILLLTLCFRVLSNELATHNEHKLEHNSGLNYALPPAHVLITDRPGIWKAFFAYYSLLIHALVIIFPLRACWAIWELTKSLQKTALKTWKTTTSMKPWHKWKVSSSTSLSSIDTANSQMSPSPSSSEKGEYWDSATESEDDLKPVVHVILIPNYKENVDGLRETLDVLASHPQAKNSYDIYLAMEQREIGAETKASQLISKFHNSFKYITATYHPSEIPGESPGKSSNLCWAARAASYRYSAETRGNMIITSIDSDSHLSWRYFSEITAMHIAYPGTASTTFYTAPIIFDRNAHLVPGIVKMADVLWCAAGLSGQYRSSTISPPTSVYSIPLELADRVGGWDAGPEAIGEDFHMYLKCFFALNGHLTTRTVTSPVSQTNVTGKGDIGILGYAQGLQARYNQALRHMWGSLDSGYAITRAAEVWRRRKNSLALCRPLHTSCGNNSDTFELQLHVDAFLEQQIEQGDSTDVVVALKPPNWFNMFLLFHRLFEAHFLPTHMSILVIASSVYRSLVPNDSGPFSFAWTLVATNILRVVGLVALLLFFYLYQKYHRICVETREREMLDARLADRMRGSFSHRSWKDVVDCIWIPLVAPIYGSIPALHAQLSHFWTLDLLYVVSNKPVSSKARHDKSEEFRTKMAAR